MNKYLKMNLKKKHFKNFLNNIIILLEDHFLQFLNIFRECAGILCIYVRCVFFYSSVFFLHVRFFYLCLFLQNAKS